MMSKENAPLSGGGRNTAIGLYLKLEAAVRLPIVSTQFTCQ